MAGPGASWPASAAPSGSTAWRRRSIGRGRRAAPGQGAVPRAPRSRRPRLVVVVRAGRGRQDAGWAGSSRSTSTGWSTPCGGTAGRCLSYGDGVAFWALAEMVRPGSGCSRTTSRVGGRGRGCDDRARTSSSPTPTERDWLRAAAGRAARGRVDGGGASPGSDLFAAWTTFFERVGERRARGAAVRGHPARRRRAARLPRPPAGAAGSRLFVLILARPELLERGRRWRPAGGPRCSPRAARRRRPWRRSSTAWWRACRREPRRRARRRAPRACRCTPWRRCGP